MEISKLIEWNNISTFRPQLMGFAAIWILLFHSHMSHLGWGGVEIFVFVSALGCYSSLSRNGKTIYFYKKRLRRIFPTYLIILGCIHLCCWILALLIPECAEKFDFPHSLWDAVCFYTTLGFWIPKEDSCCYEWYVPTIIFFYLCMPFLYKGIKVFTHKFHDNTKSVLLGTVVISYFICSFIGFLLERYGCDLLRYNLALNRIPTLMVGFVFAPIILQKHNNGGVKLSMFLTIIGMTILAMFNPKQELCMMSVKNALMLMATPGICLWIGLLFRNNFFHKIAGYLGKISLEIYLIHIFVLKLLYGLDHYIHIPRVVFVVLLLAITIVASEIFHRFIQKVLCKD